MVLLATPGIHGYVDCQEAEAAHRNMHRSHAHLVDELYKLERDLSREALRRIIEKYDFAYEGDWDWSDI